MPNTVTVSMEVGGPVRLNISSKPPGSSDERGAAELNRLGLEHFGFDVDDLESELGRLEHDGVRVVLPLTEVATGTRLAYIEGPDDVLIELVQPAA
jgi:catechol 2,3-dioxygenase-like lactoylglutathione lyase family enzyme